MMASLVRASQFGGEKGESLACLYFVCFLLLFFKIFICSHLF